MIFKGIFWLAEKIAEAVDTEITQRRDAHMVELRELHRALETGQITEEEFDSRETQILDSLDNLEKLAKSRGLS